MAEIKILWADDEIDLLKPHINFLNGKGYHVTTATNGTDAIQLCKEEQFDLIFLDENMPGLTGLETLSDIKSMEPDLPVIMITKSEEEQIMDEAIGSKITDYLIKPVNPNQILLTIKKVVDDKRLRNEKTTLDYQQEFRSISLSFNEQIDYEEWITLYKKLVFWELELQNLPEPDLNSILMSQKEEANSVFFKFIENNYQNWLRDSDKNKPLLSPNLFREKVFPLINENEPVFFILIDNLRFDQWKVIQPIISQYFRVVNEDLYFSILPTTTQYSRNSIFSGLLPLEIQKTYPELWQDDSSDEGKNLNEEKFLVDQLKRNGFDIKHSYTKITKLDKAKSLVDKIPNLMNNDLNVIIYNFVDMLSHARTDMEIIKELASNEAAYRSITLSWLEHSPLLETIKRISEYNVKLIITTDHGSIRVSSPSKVIGDRNTTSNLRYKQGKQMQYDPKDVLSITNPKNSYLPQTHINSSYIFAKEDKFFVYPNNYNYYVNFYNDTFQHGGISLEEMVIPVVNLTNK